MFDVYPHLVTLNTKVHEIVTENDDGSYSVFIDDRLTYEQQKRAYRHALTHINNKDFESDLPADVIEARAHRTG